MPPGVTYAPSASMTSVDAELFSDVAMAVMTPLAIPMDIGRSYTSAAVTYIGVLEQSGIGLIDRTILALIIIVSKSILEAA